MRWLIALILYFLTLVQATWGADIELNIGRSRIHATIANDPVSREKGLMQHLQLCGNCGMIFVFPRAGKHSFWMKNTPLPLSIAFIAADGSILNIEEMQANTTSTHSAQGDVMYALEMNKGWFYEHQIKTQDQVFGLQQLPEGK